MLGYAQALLSYSLLRIF
jgi:hypothetical protein